MRITEKSYEDDDFADVSLSGETIRDVVFTACDFTDASLADCELNRTVRVTRVIDQDAAFLQFVDRCGLTPGVTVTVEVRDTLADAVWVRPGERRPITLGTAAAAKILVEDE